MVPIPPGKGLNMVPDKAAGTRDKEATKARLLDAVGAILAREGFGALGVNSVAHEAGVDKVLIYRYFGGMTDLLHAFGQSGDFWPSITEVLGEDPSELLELPLADRWALGLSRYAEALRRRPVTKEILAWEQIATARLYRQEDGTGRAAQSGLLRLRNATRLPVEVLGYRVKNGPLISLR